jgi:UDP-glucose 4-epimerase
MNKNTHLTVKIVAPVVVDNFLSGKREFVPPQVHLIEVDITSPQIEDVFEEEKPDVVIHLAAQVDVAQSIQDPVKDAYQNIIGTVRLLTCCHMFNVQKIIFSSSCCEFALYYGRKSSGFFKMKQTESNASLR